MPRLSRTWIDTLTEEQQKIERQKSQEEEKRKEQYEKDSRKWATEAINVIKSTELSEDRMEIAVSLGAVFRNALRNILGIDREESNSQYIFTASTQQKDFAEERVIEYLVRNIYEDPDRDFHNAINKAFPELKQYYPHVEQSQQKGGRF